MNKGRRVFRLLGILFLSVSLSLQVFAAETDDEEVFFENGNTDEILFEDLQNEYPIVSESDFEDLGLSFPGIVSAPISIGTMANSSVGDRYESNNKYETATTGLMGKRISATLHDGDVDWYKMEVLDTSVPYAFVLMDIPSNCNYDMIVVNSDVTEGYVDFKEGNTSEVFYLNFESEGTYYICIQSSSGYSDTPYTLYFGAAYKDGGTGWRSSGLTFNFGYKPQGGTDYRHCDHRYYNLSNDINIPDGAVLTDFRIDNNGNGGTWGGFYKYIKTSSGYMMEQYGNLEAFDIPQNAFYVKQNWEIWGKVLYSYSFTWQPNIYIGYKYVVSPQTMRFL
ncbi:hypothetical protein SAMN02745725_03089 [Pseudobutyrivibrio xylanivorans DSM 14809]|uniref:Pre-peptidase C-terminal domain-containing protein n=1 Tax=Pseudobutyrivibrio xylanivorans DSM 14809 TaxID=1123012 RepID=A0A1M6LED4_PSEXY|nr:hypothetical protein SAMN02745725_03089 [Pseudobutyrivibrio xylanivorans DSM 14809]